MSKRKTCWVVFVICMLSLTLAVKVIWMEPYILALITLYAIFLAGLALGAVLMLYDPWFRSVIVDYEKKSLE